MVKDHEIMGVLEQVLQHYDLSGPMVQAEKWGNGHINYTYRVELASGDELIVQKINSYVFKEPVKVMHNIKAINLHVEGKDQDEECAIISFLDSKSGENYAILDGDYWRVSPFVKDSVTYDFVENSQVLLSAGYAFGRFQAILSDLPMDTLHETIPGFHDTRKRLADFFALVDKDPVGRGKGVQAEIAFLAQHRELATQLCDLRAAGEIPLRVTHNDTKYNNILMHKETYEPLCVVDLDTVMPGLAMHDFGDAIRFAANTAEEDEPDTSKVGLNLEHYREFTKGFMRACRSFLTEAEIDTMALGAIAITIELASRFLGDYLDGDKYFRIHRPNHNLDRARCQLTLAKDMIKRYDEMQAIVQECVSSKSAAS